MKGRIDAKNRPCEVAAWLKNGRKYTITPKISDPDKYKASWQNWWQGLQPQWRLLNDGTFLQKVPDIGEEWEALRRGGPNGFFMVVLAFSWAMDSVDNGGLCDALEDLKWVIGCMADISPLIGEKHVQKDEPDTSRKRYKF